MAKKATKSSAAKKASAKKASAKRGGARRHEQAFETVIAESLVTQSPAG
jgi:hypothetical protein